MQVTSNFRDRMTIKHIRICTLLTRMCTQDGTTLPGLMQKSSPSTDIIGSKAAKPVHV